MSKVIPVKLGYDKEEKVYLLSVSYPKSSDKPDVTLKFNTYEAMSNWLSKEDKYIFDEKYITKTMEELTDLAFPNEVKKNVGTNI